MNKKVAIVLLITIVLVIFASFRSKDFNTISKEEVVGMIGNYDQLTASAIGDVNTPIDKVMGICVYVTGIDSNGDGIFRNVTMKGPLQRLRCKMNGGNGFVKN